MIQIPDHPLIRLAERFGTNEDPNPPRCTTCRWYYEDEHMCCGTNREPIASPDFEWCEGWQADDDEEY